MLRKGLSINREVFALGLLSCITIALVFSVYFSVLTYNASMDRASLAIAGTNTQIQTVFEGIFGEISNIVEVFAANSDIHNAVHGDPAVIDRVLAQYDSLAGANKNIRYIYSGYADGSLLINDYVQPEGFDSALRPWYTAAVNSYPEASIGMPYREIIDGEWLLSQSKAFRHPDGRVAGVFVVDCSLDGLTEIIGGRHDFQSQRTYVIDGTGAIILHPEERFIGETIPQINEQITGQTGEFSYTIEERDVWARYATSSSTGWTFVTAVDQDEVLGPLRTTIVLHAILVVLMAFALVIAQVKLFKVRFSEPLVDLGRRVKAITEGREVEPLKRHSNPEIAEIMDNIERLTQRSLDRHRSELETILKSVQEGILVFDHERTVIYVNARLGDVLGIPKDLLAAKDGMRVLAAIAERLGLAAGSLLAMLDSDGSDRSDTITCADGLILELRTCPFRDVRGLPGRLCSFRDITEQKQALKEIEYLSFHDGLTGLYNRRYFDEELQRLDVPRNLPLTLMMLDINGLKLTNDAFGHQAGDELLARVAVVLQEVCRADDIIARTGGDEFVILLPHLDEEKALPLAKRILQSVASQKVRDLPVSVSCGWTTKSNAQESMTDVFKTAEDHMYRQKISDRNSYRHQSIDLIMKTLYAKTPREQRHSQRVSQLCRDIGSAMGVEIHELATAGMLHDIGKIAINESILNKVSPLTASEWLEIKRHPEAGYSILSSATDYGPLAESVLAHHERWDGTGYPHGLIGEAIPLASRIIALADAYDAMTSDRPYRSGMRHEDAMAEIRRCSGSQFDPIISDVFCAMMNGREAAAAENA